MNTFVMNSYLIRFKFIEDLVCNSNYELNVLDVNDDMTHISGVIKSNNDENNIPFETDVLLFDDMLMFRTIYEKGGKIISERDVFVLVKEKQSQFYNSKIKLLIHILDDDIKQIYTVSKNYKLTNGISENLGRMNMENKDVKKQLEIYKQEIVSMSQNRSVHKK